jgi:hypothetical protein
VAASSDGTKLVAAAKPGPICVSADSGATWTSNNAPILSWSSVASSADGAEFVAAATDNGIYRSTDAGLTWASIGAPSNAWSAVVASADGARLAASVRFGGIYGSADAGLTWAQIGTRSNAWSSLAASSDGTSLVAASSSGGIYIPGIPVVRYPKVIFQGLFYDTNGMALPSSGFFTASTATNGSFTARLLLAGKRYSFSGHFAADGSATNAVPRGHLRPLSVLLQFDEDTGDLSGSVSGDSWTAQLTANRNVFSKAAPPPQAGTRYTLAMTDSEGVPVIRSDASKPSDTGWGTVSVDGSGAVSFSGKLSDGTVVSQKTFVSEAEQWPLYASLYSGKGLVLGWLTFTSNVSDDLAGSVSWIKLPQPRAQFYPGGFTNETGTIGSLYQTNVPLLNISTGQVLLVNGNLPAQVFSNQFVLNITNNTLTGTNRLRFTLNPRSGSFRGGVANPVTGQTLSANGVVLQKRNLGIGSFLGASQSGEVLLLPED